MPRVRYTKQKSRLGNPGRVTIYNLVSKIRRIRTELDLLEQDIRLALHKPRGSEKIRLAVIQASTVLQEAST